MVRDGSLLGWSSIIGTMSMGRDAGMIPKELWIEAIEMVRE